MSPMRRSHNVVETQATPKLGQTFTSNINPTGNMPTVTPIQPREAYCISELTK